GLLVRTLPALRTNRTRTAESEAAIVNGVILGVKKPTTRESLGRHQGRCRPTIPAAPPASPDPDSPCPAARAFGNDTEVDRHRPKPRQWPPVRFGPARVALPGLMRASLGGSVCFEE